MDVHATTTTLALFATLGTGPLLDVNGLTQLGPGSTLQIELNPSAANLGDNDSIVLIQSAPGIQGTFDNQIITSPSGLLYEIEYTANAVRLSAITAALLAGDYNGNGVVDAADYTIWQDNLGNTLPGTGSPLTTIPEPGMLSLMMGAVLWGANRRPHRIKR